MAERYVGRFAPSPSGALHLGSLVAALASYLQARAQGGCWLLRIDDVDTPRVKTGADRLILEALERFGLRWDGQPLYQSARRSVYAGALDELKASGHAFDCGCTRREAQSGPIGLEGPIYPGTCRAGIPGDRAPRSVRFRVGADAPAFQDRVQGYRHQSLGRDIGDFVIRRADGITAYQLATVLDDAAQGVTEVVRGADLLSSTPRQIALQGALGLATPGYAHLPVLLDTAGEKLSKSTFAAALTADAPAGQLHRCLVLLGQQPPHSLAHASIGRVLRWATDNWSLAAVPAAVKLGV